MFGNFDTIDNIEGCDGKTVVMKLHNKWKGPFFQNIASPAFLTDPVVMDGVFQACGFIEFMVGNESILPYRISSATFYRHVETHGEYYCVATQVGRNDEEKTRVFNADLCDSDGNVFVRIEGFQMIAVAKVNPEDSVSNKFRMV